MSLLKVNGTGTQEEAGAERTQTLKPRSHRSDAHEHLLRSVRHFVGQSHTSPLKRDHALSCWGKFAVSAGSNSEKNRGVRDRYGEIGCTAK